MFDDNVAQLRYHATKEDYLSGKPPRGGIRLLNISTRALGVSGLSGVGGLSELSSAEAEESGAHGAHGGGMNSLVNKVEFAIDEWKELQFNTSFRMAADTQVD